MPLNVVENRIFGKASYPTIYYFTPYGSRIKWFKAHIWLIVRARFRVVAFEYHKNILAGGDPRLLPAAIAEITDWIRRDAANHKVAGVFGMSLGGYIGWNVMKQSDISYGFFCTGGVKASNAVWTSQSLAKEKLAFEEAGFGQSDLEEAWRDIDQADQFGGKKIVAVYSVADEVTTYHEASQNFAKWQAQGSDMRRIELKSSNHKQTVIRGLLKIKTLVSFFRTAARNQKPLDR